MKQNQLNDIKSKLNEIEFLIQHGKDPGDQVVDEIGDEIATLSERCKTTDLKRIESSFDKIKEECKRLSA